MRSLLYVSKNFKSHVSINYNNMQNKKTYSENNITNLPFLQGDQRVNNTIGQFPEIESISTNNDFKFKSSTGSKN